MHQARTSSGTLISAGIAGKGIYFCPECEKPVHWRGGWGSFVPPHFYHKRSNPNCYLCSPFVGNWYDNLSDRKCHEYLGSEFYMERWGQAIECLFIRNGNLEILYREPYALNPIRWYIENGNHRGDLRLLESFARVVYTFSNLEPLDIVLFLHEWSVDWDDKDSLTLRRLTNWLIMRYQESSINEWIKVFDTAGISIADFLTQIGIGLHALVSVLENNKPRINKTIEKINDDLSKEQDKDILKALESLNQTWQSVQSDAKRFIRS